MADRPDAPPVDGPAVPATEPSGRAGPRAGLAFRIAGGVLVTLVAVEAAVIECFLVPLRVGTVPVPLAAALAVAGNLAFPRMIVTVARRRSTALLPPVCWLVVVLAFAAPRGEGDLVVPGTWPALLFLFVGSIVGAYGAATAVLGGSPWRLAPRAAPRAVGGRPAGEPVASGAVGKAIGTNRVDGNSAGAKKSTSRRVSG